MSREDTLRRGGAYGAYATAVEDNSMLSLLTREQERRLRAQAWRHVRRINPKAAENIWSRRYPGVPFGQL